MVDVGHDRHVPDVLASSHGGANDRGHLRHPWQHVPGTRPPQVQAAATGREDRPPARAPPSLPPASARWGAAPGTRRGRSRATSRPPGSAPASQRRGPLAPPRARPAPARPAPTRAVVPPAPLDAPAGCAPQPGPGAPRALSVGCPTSGRVPPNGPVRAGQSSAHQSRVAHVTASAATALRPASDREATQRSSWDTVRLPSRTPRAVRQARPHRFVRGAVSPPRSDRTAARPRARRAVRAVHAKGSSSASTAPFERATRTSWSVTRNGPAPARRTASPASVDCAASLNVPTTAVERDRALQRRHHRRRELVSHARLQPDRSRRPRVRSSAPPPSRPPPRRATPPDATRWHCRCSSRTSSIP